MSIVLAVAQTIPFKGDIRGNMANHIDLIKKAAIEKTQLIFFPELSLTGYEPELAPDLAFVRKDPRLDPLRILATRHHMIIIVGAPVRMESKLHIGAFIIHPDDSEQVYTKHYLHLGEEKNFSPGKLNPGITLNNTHLRLAICADISHADHPKKAAIDGAAIYLTSAFFTPNGYDSDVELLKNYAKIHGMLVLMANYGGPSGGFNSAGQSACWNHEGKLVGSLKNEGAGLLVFTYRNSDRHVDLHKVVIN